LPLHDHSQSFTITLGNDDDGDDEWNADISRVSEMTAALAAVLVMG